MKQYYDDVSLTFTWHLNFAMRTLQTKTLFTAHSDVISMVFAFRFDIEHWLPHITFDGYQLVIRLLTKKFTMYLKSVMRYSFHRLGGPMLISCHVCSILLLWFLPGRMKHSVECRWIWATCTKVNVTASRSKKGRIHDFLIRMLFYCCICEIWRCSSRKYRCNGSLDAT